MKVITDLRQRHIETWSREYSNELGDNKSVVVSDGACVRAAVTAGIVEGVDDVGELYAWEVSQLAEQVATAINEAMKPPEKKQ